MTGRVDENAWTVPVYRRYWGGQTASLLAAQILEVSLPLIAVFSLNASSAEVGALGATVRLPYLVLALVAGVVVDAIAKRTILVSADAWRMAVVLVIPIAAASGELTVALLATVGLLAGCASVLFDVAGQAYLPALVPRAALRSANGGLSMSQSAAIMLGPFLGGVLIGRLPEGSPVLVCSVLWGISCVLVFATAVRGEPPVGSSWSAPGVRRMLLDGWALVLRSPVLRAATLTAAVFNFSYGIFQVSLLQFMPRTLGLDATQVGLVLGASGPGIAIGAMLSGWLPRRIGYGASLVLTSAVANAFLLIAPAVSSGGTPGVAVLMGMNFGFAAIGVANTIILTSMRQASTPDEIQGKVAAANRFAAMGMLSVGMLVGGFLGEVLEFRGALLIGAAGTFLALVPLCLSPLPRLRDLDAAAPEVGDDGNVRADGAAQADSDGQTVPDGRADRLDDGRDKGRRSGS